MNTNITFFRGNAAAPALRGSRATSFTQDRSFEGCRDARVPARAALAMVWRSNPANGRLECRWTAEGGTATDEGVSCNDLHQAA
ncbi:hypothetical protein ACFFWD_12225 [Bradyrhizobium erythrophlei]|uniref:hypothetical protein n=1 Tax=Bradyrhizobium erythrophlei TaxID=1437360 RepID=UPI0035E9B3F6